MVSPERLKLCMSKINLPSLAEFIATISIFPFPVITPLKVGTVLNCLISKADLVIKNWA